MNEIFKIFNDLDYLMFNRPMRLNDMNPIKFVKTESGYMAIVNTLGINEEDITVSIDGNYLVVHGETNDDELNPKNVRECNNSAISKGANEEEIIPKYTQDFKMKINDSILSSVTGIRYCSKNGITKIYIDIEKRENKIKIEKI